VYLVVRSLIRGLVKYDSMQDLLCRLNDLPTELEKYFELMLDSIELIYRCQNAQVVRLMLASVEMLPILSFDLVNQAKFDPNVPGSYYFTL
jgi:hypothetical protein